MALNNNGLGGVVQVAASGNTVLAGTTVAGDKNVFVRGLLLFNTNASSSQVCEIHVVPNDSDSPGAAAAANKIGRLTLSASDTAFFEFPYPLTLTDTGDCIRVVNDSGSAVNVLPVGDVET